MEFKQLQSFVTVVECGSFTKAAEKLFLSQPTISGHIQALEEELNKRLIIRTTKSLEITPKGQAVYEYARHILDLRERMVKDCSDAGKQIIHLGASTIPSAYILPEILPLFGQSHPDTYFVIHQSDSQGVLNGINDGLYDIGLIGMKADDSIQTIPLCTDRMVLITPVTPEYLALQSSPLSPIEVLLKHPIILREKGSGSQKSADVFLEKMHLHAEDLNVIARVNDQETIKNLVASGLGVSIISHRAAGNFLKEKRLLSFELPTHNTRTLYLAYRKGYILAPSVQDFVRFIKDHMNGEIL